MQFNVKILLILFQFVFFNQAIAEITSARPTSIKQGSQQSTKIPVISWRYEYDQFLALFNDIRSLGIHITPNLIEVVDRRFKKFIEAYKKNHLTLDDRVQIYDCYQNYFIFLMNNNNNAVLALLENIKSFDDEGDERIKRKKEVFEDLAKPYDLKFLYELIVESCRQAHEGNKDVALREPLLNNSFAQSYLIERYDSDITLGKLLMQFYQPDKDKNSLKYSYQKKLFSYLHNIGRHIPAKQKYLTRLFMSCTGILGCWGSSYCFDESSFMHTLLRSGAGLSLIAGLFYSHHFTKVPLETIEWINQSRNLKTMIKWANSWMSLKK